MAALLILALLISAMAGHSNASWCVCKDGPDNVLQKALDFACGAGADCNPIHPTGPCYNPNTVRAHCNYAVNSYFQRKGQGPGTCDFAGTAAVTPSDPSLAGCSYPSTASGAGTTTATPTTPVTTTPPTTTGNPSTTTPSTTLPSGNTPTTRTPSTTTGNPSTTTPSTTLPSGNTPTTTTPYGGTPTGVLGGVGTGLGPSGETGTNLDDSHAGVMLLDSSLSMLSFCLTLLFSSFMLSLH